MNTREAEAIKAITIMTDEETFEQLESLARASDRSRNYLANLALREFLAREGEAVQAAVGAAPIAERPEDYRSKFWREDDSEEFLTFLAEERRRSPGRDRVSELE